MQVAAASAGRAHRYEIRTDIRFRPVAVQNWHLGRTENISDTGLLVSSEEPLPINTPVQLELFAPVPLTGVAGLPLTLTGRVVRSTRDSEGPVRLAIVVQSACLAAAISPEIQRDEARLRDTMHVLTNQLAVAFGMTELLLSNDRLDTETRGRLQKIKDATMEAAATAKKIVPHRTMSQ